GRTRVRGRPLGHRSGDLAAGGLDQGGGVGETRLVLGGLRLLAGPQAILPIQRQELAQQGGTQRLLSLSQVVFQARALAVLPGRLEAVAGLLDLPDLIRGQGGGEEPLAHGADSLLQRMRMASSFRATVRREQASRSATSSLL